MNFKFELNEQYKNIKDFLLNIKKYFQENSNTIHKARNELKVINYKDVQTVVKAFRIPNKVNQIVYAYFRDSKAKKSYKNAVKLRSLGLNTPEPIGYIEFYRNFLFKESFFIAKKYEYDFTIREPLRNKSLENREEIIKKFVEFTFNLHKNNVYHKDFSAGNTLVSIKDETYEFSIVDINRMEFKTIDLETGLDNFAKLWLDEDDIILIATTYSQLANVEKDTAIDILKMCDKKLKDFVEFKRKIRGKK
ncbi:lipopolysaccharide kinase InaA family protein [Halarcobacter sp.]|uniref:lipopolysaccharide kinase InaA family protein n=1 Tax=Halarcobacter sp. TaxID=2321133 RepID=UPI003B005034